MLKLLLAALTAALAAVVLAGALPGAARGQSLGPSALPEGPGKEQVESVCTACHPASQITRSSGYTQAVWSELTATMIDLSGNPELREEITGYLAVHFPPNQRKAARPVSGRAQIAFKEWQVPSLGQRSRDPIEAPDGTIWWAGQWGNLIGKIDPVTGAMAEYPLHEGAKPHTVTLDAAGNVWYTGNKNGTIGRFDPRTEEMTVNEAGKRTRLNSSD